MVEELLAARGIDLTYETMRCWAQTFGLAIAKCIRSTAPGRGDKWHLVVTIKGKKHWLWRAVDQHGAVLDVLVQSRRDNALGEHRAERFRPAPHRLICGVDTPRGQQLLDHTQAQRKTVYSHTA